MDARNLIMQAPLRKTESQARKAVDQMLKDWDKLIQEEMKNEKEAEVTSK